MIDSQAQIRWLAAATALIVFVIGPVTAGMLFRDARAEAVVVDASSWDRDSVDGLREAMKNSAETVIFQLSAGKRCAGGSCSLPWYDDHGNVDKSLPQTKGATIATRVDAPKHAPTNFIVFDVRSWDKNNVTSLETAVGDADWPAIFLVRPDATGECGSEGVTCPSLDSALVEVPMSPDHTNTAERLENVYPKLETTDGTTKVTRPGETFDLTAAALAGGVLLIGVLLVAGLVARQPRRPVPATRHRDLLPRPIPGVPRDEVPTSSPWRSATTPVLMLAAVPGAREVVREYGATAKARSHIDSTGGYVVLGDVLMWATPVDGGVAYPDDDVRVAMAVSSTPDGGLRP